MIYELRHLIPSSDNSTQGPFGWVRAMHLPFYGGLIDRAHDAWEVFCGRAYAVRWPKAGDFEQASDVGSHTLMTDPTALIEWLLGAALLVYVGLPALALGWLWLLWRCPALGLAATMPLAVMGYKLCVGW